MTLDILVPQYKETDAVIKPLLDSIALQQLVCFDDIGVIIVNDGSDVFLSEELLNNYPFKIHYYKNEHKGVSGTRQKALDLSEADYVMFCDADDMFFNMCGLWLIFREMNNGFDTLTSAFVEEARKEDGSHTFINHEMDSTFVHGKVHRRKYLLEQNIKWNENLTLHEDSFFNVLCQKLTKNLKYCPVSFFLWKWRDDSVCRNDKKYDVKTYNNILKSNSALVREFLNRKMVEDARSYAAKMIFGSFFALNKEEWFKEDNAAYKLATDKCFSEYYKEFKDLFVSYPEFEKEEILKRLMAKYKEEKMHSKDLTFGEWIKYIESIE